MEEEKGIQSVYQFAEMDSRRSVDEDPSQHEISRATKGSYQEALEAFRDALLSLDVIAIQLDSGDDAYVVFET